MIDQKQLIQYALAKQIPAMLDHGCTIQTTYGDIEITGDEAKQLTTKIETILKKRLGEK